ncbi:Protein of unknown function [Microlunatus sagamiharensis]|uniref:Right handed beta helix region n=1 Tax=Microlunatus sagamiharensis TaxID=546874 RepID=A0A1H2ML41_9ACTN|nr:right-handed parallel beta-helix repeat-containing protein [Microlunatus sagamiharensis]SDU93641.1 Protein of unknown function [Microlunatus sagamiharensis]
MTTFHVATTGDDAADGSAERPFRTIDRGARAAHPGDTVQVHAGEYREWVVPRRGGLGENRRITYEAAPGEHVVVKGSERVTGWEQVAGPVWRVRVPNALFGDFNPYVEEIDGDWIVRPERDSPRRHLGEVYLDGVASTEVATVAEVGQPERRTEVTDHWTGIAQPVEDPDQTQRVWHAEVDHALDGGVTTITANFGDADPNAHLVEINVRRSVFYPLQHHLDFITVRGFELAQAACPWTPPTADQPALIGPNWARGWVIEDNDIHDAKCSAVSLGKEASTGHNWSTTRLDKPGYQYQLESVFSAEQIGWDAEHVGSHVVRRNHIHHCGQNGVVGHLGCVFSTIEDNHIHHIADRREFYGYEIGGIKLHAAIDVEIRHNYIHDCSLGTWLDWETQGTRVSRNVFARNSRDLFVEVSHGPYVVDHNVFGSPVSVESFSQGGAYVGNVLCGSLRLEKVMDRATPYHRAHSTQVAGYAVIYGADDRWVANLFLGGQGQESYGHGAEFNPRFGYGTALYDGHPTSFADYLALVDAQPPGDHDRYPSVPQPAYVRSNVYADGATAFEGEPDALVLDGPVAVRVVTEGEEVYLETELPEAFLGTGVGVVTGADLEHVRFAGLEFEERDGSPVVIDVDLLGERKEAGQTYPAFPVAGISTGTSRTRVW